MFRVDAVDFGDLRTCTVLHHDGLWGSAIWRYDGTPATTDRFLTDSRQIPFAAAADDARGVLIIGAAGGNEIQAALTYGVGHSRRGRAQPGHGRPVAQGSSPSTPATSREHPRVNYVQGDGRTFLARSDDEYDLIWFVAPDSYAASNAATSGAFVLSESYLYTRR